MELLPSLGLLLFPLLWSTPLLSDSWSHKLHTITRLFLGIFGPRCNVVRHRQMYLSISLGFVMCYPTMYILHALNPLIIFSQFYSFTQVDDIVGDMKTVFPGVRLGIHCHNDQGLAVANSLQAVRSGVDVVQVRANHYWALSPPPHPQFTAPSRWQNCGTVSLYWFGDTFYGLPFSLQVPISDCFRASFIHVLYHPHDRTSADVVLCPHFDGNTDNHNVRGYPKIGIGRMGFEVCLSSECDCNGMMTSWSRTTVGISTWGGHVTRQKASPYC